MAVTSTGLQILQLLLQRAGIGEYIPNADVTSLSTTVLTSTRWFANGNYGVDHFRNKLQSSINRPGNATGVADDIRWSAALAPATGAITFDRSVTDGTLGAEDFYLLYHNIHIAHVIDAMNLALRQIYFQNEDWLSLAADPGFQSSGVTSYVESDADAGPATTFTKITTADSFNVLPTFISSGRVLNAAANGYIRQRFKVRRGEEVYIGWLARADVGADGAGMSLVLYDLTNSALLGTAISSSEENWQYLWRKESVTSGASGTEDLEVRLQGIGASDDLYMNGLIVYRTSQRILPISSNWDTHFSTPSLSYVTFGQNTADHVEDAWSMQKHPIDPSEYRWLRTKPGANPYAIEFKSTRWFQHPILINGRRAHIDIDGPFTRLLTETTSIDRDLIEAATRVNLFSDPRVEMEGKAALRAKAKFDYREYGGQFEFTEPPRDDWAQSRMPN